MPNNLLESEFETVLALSMLYESSKESKANYHPPTRWLSQSNHRTRSPPSIAIVEPHIRSQSKSKAILHPEPVLDGKSASAGIPDSEVMSFPSLIQHGPSHGERFKETAERSVWFPINSHGDLHSYSHLTMPYKDRPFSFSQCHCRGAIMLKTYTTHMRGMNVKMGCRITQDRIMLLDGHGRDYVRPRGASNGWLTKNLNEASLEIENFCKHFPLKTDGLVVGFSDNNQLVIASYGKPPLGAILLRPKVKNFVFVARSSDDTIDTVNVQDGDIVVIAALERISQLESGKLKLDSKDLPEEIVQTVYSLDKGRSLCIVATINAGKSVA